MNDPHRAEKLALARKKLKDFESRRNNGASPGPAGSLPDGRCSSLSNASGHSIDRIDVQHLEREPFMVVNSNGGDNLHIDRQTNGSSVSSINSSIVMTNGTQEEQATISPNFSSAIESRLVQERDAAQQASEQLKLQLADLHSHYAHLHAAYSQLSASGVHTDMEQQIIQLQSAISVLVEEKTMLQAELRSSKEQFEQFSISQTKSQAENVNYQLEHELRHLRASLEQSNSLVKAQAAEMEQLRRQYADTHAKNLTIQNEKSEAQLRVRALVKDKESQNEELTAIKKELQMKNLHIKQLSAHQIHSPADAAASDQIQSLTDRLEAMTNELIRLRSERDGLAKETETTRRQFEDYSADLGRKMSELRNQLETAENQKNLLEERSQELEMQLIHLQKPPNSSSEALPTITAPHPALEENQKKIAKLEEKLADLHKTLAEERHKYREDYEKQADQQAQKEEELLNLSIKYRQLEERLNESRGNASELISLSEQLQSEKATVSRAVAQNKELKEQLIETEDRLVAVTNDKMQFELAKQAAEHQVRVLTEQLVQAQNGMTGGMQMDSGGHDHLDTSAVEALAMKNEREQELEQKLQQSVQELADIRQELRQSHNRNEQMNQIMMNNAEDENQNSIHVELGQALERMGQLAQENELLRESLAASQQREAELGSRLVHLEEEKKERDSRKANSPVLPIENEEEKSEERHSAPVQEENHQQNQEQPDQETTPQGSRKTVDEHEDDQVMQWFSQVPQKSNQAKSRYASIDPEEVEKWARTELEKKFTGSMRRIAELMDTLDKMEHINVQLQMENETIGDHVILYHQQRRIIRDRLRAKDQQLLSMEAEKQRVLGRCRELQLALKEVLAARNADGAPPARKVCRTFSHSTVDEMSGDEDVVVPPDELLMEPSTSQMEDVFSKEEGRKSPQVEGTEAKVQRIFNILEEISTTPVASAEDLHCSQCIGELKKL